MFLRYAKKGNKRLQQLTCQMHSYLDISEFVSPVPKTKFSGTWLVVHGLGKIAVVGSNPPKEKADR